MVRRAHELPVESEACVTLTQLTNNGYYKWIAGAALVIISGVLLAMSVRLTMLDALKQDSVIGAALSQRVNSIEAVIPAMHERITKMDLRIERIEAKAEAILERVVRIESRLEAQERRTP